jgi:hypothetical protein
MEEFGPTIHPNTWTGIVAKIRTVNSVVALDNVAVAPSADVERLAAHVDAA